MYDTIMRMSDLFYSHLLISVPLLPAAATIYVLPMLLASERRHKHANAIVVFNILTGWTFFGWVISFVWALTEENQVK
jgi:Superinfection immunity protein